jgi:hypothetical protein
VGVSIFYPIYKFGKGSISLLMLWHNSPIIYIGNHNFLQSFWAYETKSKVLNGLSEKIGVILLAFGSAKFTKWANFHWWFSRFVQNLKLTFVTGDWYIFNYRSLNCDWSLNYLITAYSLFLLCWNKLSNSTFVSLHPINAYFQHFQGWWNPFYLNVMC